MTREEAIKQLKKIRKFYIYVTPNPNIEALDLAIEALKGDFHCPKCGTIVRDGRQYHDLVYRGEAEPKEMTLEEWQELDREIQGDTSKLKNPCDSLLKPDSDECKEQKSKLDCISRQQAIEAIECVDWYHVNSKGELVHGSTSDEESWYRAEDVYKAIESLPPVTPTVSEDCISRQKAIETCDKMYPQVDRQDIKTVIEATPSVTPTERTGEWIPVSERLPKDLEEVVVTWVNRNPPVYYRHEKDKPQTGFAVLYRDTWHWWDSTIVDVLAEYGLRCDIEHISEDIEILAWQPLPEPYKGGDTE